MNHAAAWPAWSLVGLSVALIVGSFALTRMTEPTDLELPYNSTLDVVVALAIWPPFSVVGAIVASRQPRNTIGWIFCTSALVIGLAHLANAYAEYWLAGGWGSRSLGEAAAWFSSWVWSVAVVVPTTFLLLLFPDGRLHSPRWRPVAWLAALGVIGLVAGLALEAGPLGDFPQIANPYGVDNPVVGVATLVANVLVGICMVAAISVIRVRRAGRVERQQIKWLAYGGAVVVGLIFVAGLISIWSATASIAVISSALFGMPIFTGIAIVRYRLHDIDIIINRTLVYGSLTATLAMVYFGGVTLTQAPLRTLTSEEQLPQLVVVASTLVVAAMFDPLRHRVQSLIDRRFYRRKYDAAKTLEGFYEKLRDETDLEALRGDLVGVVRDTMQPAHVSLWLRPVAEMGRSRESA